MTKYAKGSAEVRLCKLAVMSRQECENNYFTPSAQLCHRKWKMAGYSNAPKVCPNLHRYSKSLEGEKKTLCKVLLASFDSGH